jgi:hypothetical protein
MATRVLDEGSPWEAGQRLMQTAAPESWGVIVAASPLVGWQPRGGAEMPRAGRQGQKAGALHDRREGASLPRIWIPRALCFWRMVVSIGGTISLEQLAHPAHSLARWPAIEQAVRSYLAISAPDLILIDSARESATRH